MPRDLTLGTFNALRELITAETGISLHDGKRNFVAARLLHRVRELHLPTYDAYYTFAKTNTHEREHLVNAITTNKTSFFREAHHFAMMSHQLVPRLIAKGMRRVRVWSAGCSSGEEPYSIAMTLLDKLPEGWDVKVLASDIDTDMLARAESGVYSAETAASIPKNLRDKFTETLEDGRIRMNPLVRSSVVFRRINLNAADWPVRARFDAIFCRNVVIYFDQLHQRKLFERFARLMSPDAVLVLGHSETLHWMPQTFRLAGATTYRLAGEVSTPQPTKRVPDDVRDARRITVGEVFASAEPRAVRTLLGSCIATCLYDPVARVGGMNHFLLPSGGDEEPTSARFGVHAMELLINAIMRAGGDRRRLEAKIFGGSHVIDMKSSVAVKNVEFVRRFLATENITITAELVGGDAPLDVCLFTATGKVLARRLQGTAALSVVAAESQWVRKPVRATADSGIVLFHT